MRTLKTSRRFAGLIAVLMLATGITAASAQTEDRKAHGKSLELTYTKWFDPGFPHMVGVVGGDMAGQFGGAVLEAKPDGGVTRLRAIYIVLAEGDPSRSLTIRVSGQEQSGTAVLEGRVVVGWLTGARARAQFKVIDCPQSDGPCFQGTISIKYRND
jgi:hypothetical protein